MKKIKLLLPLVVLLLALLYGIGDHLKCWDFLSGRTNALASYDRLSSNKGFPEIYVKNTDPEFFRFYSFLINRVQEMAVQEFHKKKIKPVAIVRAGGTLGHELKKQMPPDFPDVRFAPNTLPILFIYNLQENDKAARACNLADLRSWIEESRNRERFIVSTLLIGLLSIIVVILQYSKNT